MPLNERFNEVRNHHSLSQSDFSKRLGVGRTTISDIESGRINPKPQVIEKLHEIFDINLNWLFCGTGRMKVSYVIPEPEKREFLDQQQDYSLKDKYIATLEENKKMKDELTEAKDKLTWYELNCDCGKTKQPDGKRIA